MKKMNLKKGFTLIELLVVIALIGALASVVLAVLGSSKDKGQDARRQSQLKSLLSQAQLYSGPTGTAVPGTIAAIIGDDTPTRNLFTSTVSTDNSLYNIMTQFPTGTVVYYAWDGNAPLPGGKWTVVVTGSKGAYCIDYTSFLKSWVGTLTTPLSAGDLVGNSGPFPNAKATGGYLCS